MIHMGTGGYWSPTFLAVCFTTIIIRFGCFSAIRLACFTVSTTLPFVSAGAGLLVFFMVCCYGGESPLKCGLVIIASW